MTEPPPPTTPTEPPPLPSTPSTTVIHPRREPFEHGLLPIPKLIFSDPTQTLISFKHKLLQSSSNNRVDSVTVSDSLQISVEHAKLVLDTIASILPYESESDTVDVHDLVLFLYIQSYKRLLPRTHKDSAAVADVWPSTSAFDGYLSALSPLQLVRSNSKRFTPSQADEEAHQLSYLQKHLANIVSLLAEPVEGESEESLVLNCHESAIYILAPLRYATIYGCSDATIFIGAVGKAVRVEHCERVHVIVAAKRICIANCRECVFFLGVNQQPLIVGDNHKLQVAPFNTFYSQLEEHMNEVGVLPTVNRWDEPIALGIVDPHDSLSHPAGVSDVQTESATRVDPDQFTNFVIPKWLGGESTGSTKDNPFILPEAYMASQQRNEKNLGEIRQLLREAPLEESRKRELSSALHVYFKDWLYASGNIRQLYYLQGD
ncbi:hypothetical protein TSUD_331430 [Trifolium subterraneum]|uniref:TBCC domain-containing protein 1 n=1 Tax=Trifolium subterraneum TaxID=3900 RepID=A0A2Z6MJS3_TRISU|nr:hypothetical protein TSUD_331430 [Trifolium subterraneum]